MLDPTVDDPTLFGIGAGGCLEVESDTAPYVRSISLGPEPYAGIRVKRKLRCKSTDKAKFGRAKFTVCVQHREGGVFRDLGCKVRWTTTEVELEVDALCLAGRTQVYRPRTSIYLQKARRTAYSEDMVTSELPCNEAGAWRRSAKVNSQRGTPVAQLKRNMPTGYSPGYGTEPGDAQQMPTRGTPTGQHGWDAHHIIPSGDRRAPFADAQAYAYACGLPPNGAVNGVWLRGYRLKYGTSGYANLTDAQKKRAYHPRTYRNAYGQWIKDELRPYVNPDGECINQSGLWAKVRFLWGALRLGQTESN